MDVVLLIIALIIFTILFSMCLVLKAQIDCLKVDVENAERHVRNLKETCITLAKSVAELRNHHE